MNLIPQAVTMTSREIAELVGSRHDDVKRSIERLSERGVIVHPPMADEPGMDSVGRPRTTRVCVFSGEKGKRDSIVVVAQLSPEFTAKLVDRWQELESGIASQQAQLPKLEAELRLLSYYAQEFRPAPSSHLALLAKVGAQNGADTSFLPAYAVDAAPDALASSSMPTKALTALLKDRGIRTTAVAVNRKLEAFGYLERKTRKNSKGEDAWFWSITEVGLRYGKNITSTSNPRETQPHWYEARFADLMEVVGVGEQAAA